MDPHCPEARLAQTPGDGCMLMRSVLDSLAEQIAVLDMDGVIVAVNSSWRRFAEENGASQSCETGPQNYLHTCDGATGTFSEEATPAAEGIRRVLGGALPEFRLEYPCHSPTEQRWFLMYVTPLWHCGSLSGAVVSHLLITDRILAETRQRESEARLRVAQRLAHVGSFKRDLASGVGFWSEELFRIFGHEPDEFSPSFADFLERVHPEDKGGVAELFAQGRSDGIGFQAEFRILSKGGGERYVALVCDFERTASGQPTHYHGAILDITERHRAAEQLRTLAHTDPLTGVANRRHFLDILHAERERALRFRQPLSLVMVDLDDFKRVNDTLGHAVGDQMLRHVTGIIAGALRSVDTLGRLGGEEFCVLLPQTDLEAGLETVRRLLARIRSQPLALPQGGLRQTVSCGLATLTDSQDLDVLLKNADDALYRAKAAGKDRVLAHGQP